VLAVVVISQERNNRFQLAGVVVISQERNINFQLAGVVVISKERNNRFQLAGVEKALLDTMPAGFIWKSN